MARRKKIENETPEQARQRHIFESISNYPERSEKTSWQRKLVNLEKLVAELRPIEETILDLMSRKAPLVDKITELRREMVDNCLHPYDMLILHDDHVTCTFCNRKLSIPNEFRKDVNI